MSVWKDMIWQPNEKRNAKRGLPDTCIMWHGDIRSFIAPPNPDNATRYWDLSRIDWEDKMMSINQLPETDGVACDLPVITQAEMSKNQLIDLHQTNIK